MSNEKLKLIACRLEPDAVKQLEAVAKAEDRPVASVVKRAILSMLRDREAAHNADPAHTGTGQALGAETTAFLDTSYEPTPAPKKPKPEKPKAAKKQTFPTDILFRDPKPAKRRHALRGNINDEILFNKLQ